MNRFIFDEKFYYTLHETLKIVMSETEEPLEHNVSIFSKNDFIEMCDILGLDTAQNPLDYTIFKDLSNNVMLPLVVFNRVIERYEKHYLAYSQKPWNGYNPDIASIGENDVIERVKSIIRILELTYTKYATIMKLYEDNKSKLMDKLETSSSETHTTTQNEQHASISGDTRKLKINDTPQNENNLDEYEGDGYISEFHKEDNTHNDNGNSSITGGGSITRSSSSDPAPIIARIHEIEQSYSLVMKKWLNEFSEVFIEEGNV